VNLALVPTLRTVALLTATTALMGGQLVVAPGAQAADDPLTAYSAWSQNEGSAPDTEYFYEAPTVVSQCNDIVLRGTGGYLAKDGVRGSVVNFFVDAESSGDPNTLYTKHTVTHPITGAVVGDKRTHAMVQANADGTWQVRIPFPTSANSRTLDGTGDVDALWAPGTSHSVRMLTGTLLDNQNGDHRRFVSAHFTIGASQTVASSTTTVRLAKPSHAYGDRTTATVTVASPCRKPSGQVRVSVGGTVVTGTLNAAGSVTVTLPADLRPGTRTVTASYAGATGITGSVASTSHRVAKASPKVSFRFAKSTVKTSQRAKVTVAASIPGAARLRPYGKVVVRDGTKVIATRTLKPGHRGKLTVTLPKLKNGKHRIRVTLAGNAVQTARTTPVKRLTVRR